MTYFFILSICLVIILPVLAMFIPRLIKPKGKKVIGFFHPYCNDGGGGERVLWRMVDNLQKMDKDNKLEIAIYSGDLNVTPHEILAKIKNRFGFELTKTPKFIFLKSRFLVEAHRYPYFTIICQSLASMILALEALWKLCPDVFLDTMGYSFTFPIFSIFGGSYVAAYVHYPTISTNMLQSVSNRNSSFNNNNSIALTPWKTKLKLLYYHLFAKLYWVMGQFSKITLTNSTWTYNHIKHLWNPSNLQIVYPPCHTKKLQEIPLSNRSLVILSLAQFRPEKNHMLQIQIIERIRELNSSVKLKLLMVGSLRVNNSDDEMLVRGLEDEIKKKNLQDYISIKLNVSNVELQNLLATSLIGLHTMENEHFGIGIVELQAAGLIVVAHNSAGPKEDIVVPINNSSNMQTGFLATTSDEYAKAILNILELPKEKFIEIQHASRENSNRFSDEVFSETISQFFQKIIGSEI